jgi:hypothetical protein
MRIQVSTTHSVTVPYREDVGDENSFELFVDCDGTAQLRLDGFKDEDDSTRVKSRWLGRRELIELRAVISRAIGLLDDTD